MRSLCSLPKLNSFVSSAPTEKQMATPTDTCWFCESDAAIVTLRWKSLVWVPRCVRCAEVHQQASELWSKCGCRVRSGDKPPSMMWEMKTRIEQ